MSKQFYEISSPGKHLRLEYRKDGQLHVILNKETIAKVDVEIIHDMTEKFLTETLCTRPGVRRRKGWIVQAAENRKHFHASTIS